MVKTSFELKLENDKLLAIPELIKFCVLNQHKDVEFQVINEAHCLEYTGVYDILSQFDFASVQFNTSNVLERHDLYKINNDHWYHWLQYIDKFDYNYDLTWNESKIFGCFYGRPSAPRLGIAGHLAKHHRLISDIHVQFDFNSADNRKLFDIERLFTWHPESIDNLPLLRNIKTHHYYHKGHYTQSNTLSHSYKNIMIDIISEPVCSGRSFYPTEKIVRAILCRRPFIVMASSNYLKYLRQLGFHTFNEFWDETYDGLDRANRYIKILDLIDHLASLPKQRLVDIFYASQYQRDFNFDLLTAHKFTTDLVTMDE